MNAQTWIELAAVIVGAGSAGTAVAKVHRLAVAVEKVAGAVVKATVTTPASAPAVSAPAVSAPTVSAPPKP